MKNTTTGTPRQIAFLKFHGVTDADNLSRQEIDEIMRNDCFEWIANRYNLSHLELDKLRSSDWHRERLILHPDLYSKELNDFINSSLREEMGTYVRGQYTGSSERITKEKIQESINSLIKENPNWWNHENSKKVFLDRFSRMFPKSCDGKRPDTNFGSQKFSNIPHISAVPPIPTPSKKSKNRVSVSRKSFPFVKFLIFLLIAIFGIRAISCSGEDKLMPQSIPSQTAITQSKTNNPDPSQEFREITTLDSVVLPTTIISTKEFNLLNKEREETPIPVGTVITVEKRSDSGTLTTRINGEAFFGIEERIAGKAKIRKNNNN